MEQKNINAQHSNNAVTYFLIENDIANGFTITFFANIDEELAKKIDYRD